MNKQKIVFVIPSLCKGGAERVVVNLADCMANTYGCDVTVITFYGSENEYGLHSGVKRMNLEVKPQKKIWGKISILIMRTLKLRLIFKSENFTKVFSFMDGANIPTALTGSQCFLSIRTNVDFVSKFHRFFYFLYKRKNVLKMVCLTNAMKNKLEDIGFQSLAIIHNPLISIKSSAEIEKISYNYILAVGRLARSKNHSLLIQSYANSILVKNNIRLLIAGEGPERPLLEKLIVDLGLQANVELMGLLNDAQLKQLYSNTLFLVMSSNYESWGNVLTESLVHGTPIISTDCPQGPSDIITHGKNGLLVPVGDREAMTGAMNKLYEDEKLYLNLKKNTQASVAHLSVEKITKQWLEL